MGVFRKVFSLNTIDKKSLMHFRIGLTEALANEVRPVRLQRT